MLNSAYSAAQVNDTADLAQQEKKYLLPLIVSNRQNISTPYPKKNTAQEQSASTENVTDHLFRQQPANAQLTRWMTPVRSVKNPMSGN